MFQSVSKVFWLSALAIGLNGFLSAPAALASSSQLRLSGRIDSPLSLTAQVFYTTSRKIPFLCGSDGFTRDGRPAWQEGTKHEDIEAQINGDQYTLDVDLESGSGGLCGWEPQGLVILNVRNSETGHVNQNISLWQERSGLYPDLSRNTGVTCQERKVTGSIQLLVCENQDQRQSGSSDYEFSAGHGEIRLDLSFLQ